MIDISAEEYESLIRKAKAIDPVNFMDMVHDHLLTGQSLNAVKFDYLKVNQYDTTKFEDTAKACNKCNKIKPAACFRIQEVKGKLYLRCQCTKCEGKAYAERKLKRYKSDPEFRGKRIEKVA